MSAKKLSSVLVGDQVIEKMRQMWIDGFMSGAATALEAAGCPEKIAGEAAQKLVDKLYSDPLAILTIEAEVKERLIGVDSGDKSLTIKGDEA